MCSTFSNYIFSSTPEDNTVLEQAQKSLEANQNQAPGVMADVTDKGLMKQIVGNDQIQFYVQGFVLSQGSDYRKVDVSMLFKNSALGKQHLSPSQIRLVDNQFREYEPEYSLTQSAIYLPSQDTLNLNLQFKILPTNNVSKIYFMPENYNSRFTVDLTKVKDPPDSAPSSGWVLSSNKGVKIDNRELELTVNDEGYEGKSYVIDVTLKNLANKTIRYDASDFTVKNDKGVATSENLFSNLVSPLLSGELSPGDIVRGDISFDVGQPNGNMMIIFSGSLGIPFLNTGSLLPPQINSKVSGNTASIGRPHVMIAGGSSDPNNGEFFVPETLAVSKGVKVEWSNDDTTLHTVTSGSPNDGNAGTEFDSVYMATGASFTHIFGKSGTYDYYCTLHPFMKGKIIVK